MSRVRSAVVPLARAAVAAGLVALVLPPTAPAAHADESAPAYGGFSSVASAAPIHVEIYEPSIPIPATPQAEVALGYTKVAADSGSSKGRASYLWPGDSVGEGLPTFAEQLGLPPDAFDDGYPVQVNSSYPSDLTEQTDEPLPGMVMRTTAGDKTASAQGGFSPDSGVSDPESDGPDGGGGSPSLDGLLGLLSGLGQLDALPRGTATTADAGVPGLPAPLTTLIDLEGFASSSRTSAVDGPVVSASRTILGDVRLLGGLITLSGIDVRARAVTDGTTGEAGGRADWGALSLAGKEFAIGPEGLVADGAPLSLPGLPLDPATALLQLGISIQVPEPTRTVEGDQATSTSSGLIVVIDTAVLAPVLRALPAAALAQLLPDQAGPLKSVIGGLSDLKPRIVITLGTASASVDTEPPIEVTPPGETTDPPADNTTGGKPPKNGGSTGAGPGAAPPGDAGPPTTDAGGFVDTSAPTLPGLPPLFSIPGMLLIGSIAAAAFAGTWFRRLGLAALGGGAACSHGLDSGLPDLRKA
ncbi:hypothetical protein F0U44_19020 [Nocardioides humilatus]|uniref:Choice-of-anchor G family protein n=1 Tax=Nocardioides humilatus TaxID=2607660 RepID=A0A5B1L895_9ACTN|nr:hypothetical protein [Nocardioides humilatus]KAA1416408.1 hypothetical protein F0U44_19020 [Nocardioides humilatus]